MFSPDLLKRANDCVAALRTHQIRIVTVESCTGGLIASVLTEIAGASDVVECGLVTYSNEAKTALAGVPETLIAKHGAVSTEVARAMAEGALARTPRAAIAVAVTGIAGPTGGTAEKPVGLVHLAIAVRNSTTVHQRALFGDIGRSDIRLAAVRAALTMIRENL